jgi:uncharacterized protein YjbI with pentapeptide repeats
MVERPPQPADDNTKAHQRRLARELGGVGLLGLGLLVVMLLACVLWIPRGLYPPLSGADLRGVSDAAKVQDLKSARLKLQNDARTTLLQGLGALLVLSGAGIGASVTLRQIRETATANRAQLEQSERGQVTDRYTKAIDQLDKEKALAVRLGGLYALERIAYDSRDDRSTIAEVLCAYARTAPRDPPSRSANDADPPITDAASGGTPATAPPSLTVRAPDVQAALTILGRWRERLGEPPPVLDLHDADLQGASLDGAQLQDARLDHAQLQHAHFLRAQLQGANLEGAQLQDARLDDAQLQGANLNGAQLQDAHLDSAQLQGATLRDAQLSAARLIAAQLHDVVLNGAQLNVARLDGAQLPRASLIYAQLQYANLEGAQLQDAALYGADLENADLFGAQLQNANFEAARLQGAKLKGAQLQRARLERAQLQDANLEAAQLQGTNLKGAQLQGAILRNAELQGARASEPTRWPEGWDSARARAAGVQLVDFFDELIPVDADTPSPDEPAPPGIG